MGEKDLQRTLKALFTKCIIINTEVKRGSISSSNIYVPKEYVGKKTTVIIWDK